MGVEWGSSWPPQDLARDGGSGGSDGAGSGEGGLKDCSLEYELFYTVPDHLRRPWQVTLTYTRFCSCCVTPALDD